VILAITEFIRGNVKAYKNKLVGIPGGEDGVGIHDVYLACTE
jgi:hypothetical protein